MAKVYQETDDMSREELVNLLLEKDKKIIELESMRKKLLEIYGENKVSDTFRILRERRDDFIESMEDLLCKIKHKQ